VNMCFHIQQQNVGENDIFLADESHRLKRVFLIAMSICLCGRLSVRPFVINVSHFRLLLFQNFYMPSQETFYKWVLNRESKLIKRNALTMRQQLNVYFSSIMHVIYIISTILFTFKMNIYIKVDVDIIHIVNIWM